MIFYLFQIYNSELENHFDNFEDWLCIFPLHRGKANEDEDGNEDEHFVGKYKVLRNLNDACAACGRKSLGPTCVSERADTSKASESSCVCRARVCKAM